ncbi:MAG: RNase adapter RapZ [Bacteroidales bacterium]
MKALIDQYERHFGKRPDKVEEIPLSVSLRRYYRMYDGADTCIGTYSPDVRETVSFTTFANHFRGLGLNVPEIIAVGDDQQTYLQSDLGDTRLHELIVSRSSNRLDEKLLQLYRSAIDQLVKMQVEGDKGLDYSVAVPRPAFDKQSVLWDLNHFKYYFLKLSGIPFDEQQLEEAFDVCAEIVSGVEPQGFMFRDFQSRNIMVSHGEVYLIDFQGGRRGPLHYDLASLLLQSNAALNGADRDQLISYYLERLSTYREVDRDAFMADYYLVALVRVLQALGAYGLRGLIEKKAVFLQSIPAGLENLENLLEKIEPGAIAGYLRSILQQVASAADRYPQLPEAYDGLTVTIYSFSYRRPGPDDLTGNGGGFVYDCRFLSNPGRCDEMRMLNGFDTEVIRFLEEDPAVPEFLDSIKLQLQRTMARYREMDYRNLMVSFGCTGGRHRSVYVAHAIAEWCRSRPGVRVLEFHREMEIEL